MTIFKKYAALFLLSSFAIGGITAQTITSKSPHSDAHKQLLANQAKSKDQIRLVEKNTFIDLIDDIEPEPDIYTEGWNSKAVNPFKESDVPDTQVIDVTGYVMPVPGKVTSNYGYRRRFGRMHKGIDLAIRNNDTIYAAFDGKCRLTAYERKGYGNYVILRHPNGLETVYGHLNKPLVKADQVVKAGDPIGLGGSTGRSTGPHLHFETRFMGYAINPSAIFDFANQTTHTDTHILSINVRIQKLVISRLPAKRLPRLRAATPIVLPQTKRIPTLSVKATHSLLSQNLTVYPPLHSEKSTEWAQLTL